MKRFNSVFRGNQSGSKHAWLWLKRRCLEKQLIVLLFFLPGCSPAGSQTITGTLILDAGSEIRLVGFNGFETYLINRSDVSANGRFTLSYSGDNPGMGLLVSSEDQSFMVVLSGENIELRGESLSMPETIIIDKSVENLLFEQYASDHPRREQSLSAWIYLENIYRSDSLFAVHEVPRLAIAKEMERIRREDQDFLDSMDPNSYAGWYLPVRKRVSTVSVVAQYRTGEIPETIEFFRQLNYTDKRLQRSGLLGDVIESQVWLIENSGIPLDSVFLELNHSIDGMLKNLSADASKLNEITDYLFDLLERRSLFTSAEYLANKLLEKHGQLLGSRLADKLESYRAMKAGSTAPDILFNDNTLFPDGVAAARLSEIDADYILVIFAAGWCPHCRQMMPELAGSYTAWRNAGVEVVLVSLDDTPESFTQFTSGLPFIRTTDYRRWESPMARDYHVHSIPSKYLLDRNLKILLHPNSVDHLDAWVDWYLVQGN